MRTNCLGNLLNDKGFSKYSLEKELNMSRTKWEINISERKCERESGDGYEKLEDKEVELMLNLGLYF